MGEESFRGKANRQKGLKHLALRVTRLQRFSVIPLLAKMLSLLWNFLCLSFAKLVLLLQKNKIHGTLAFGNWIRICSLYNCIISSFLWVFRLGTFCYIFLRANNWPAPAQSSSNRFFWHKHCLLNHTLRHRRGLKIEKKSIAVTKVLQEISKLYTWNSF